MTSRSLARVFACLLLLCVAAFSQDNLGLPNFGSFETHQYDTINLQNLNVLVRIPVRNKNAHYPMSYEFVGNNNLYVYTNVSTQITGVGGGMQSLVTKLTSPNLVDAQYTLTNSGNCANGTPTTRYYGWIMTDSVTGTVHKVDPNLTYDSVGCLSNGFTATALDRSGLVLTVSHNPSTQIATYTIMDKSGNTGSGGQIHDLPGGVLSGTNTFTDLNGNSITKPINGSTTDMFGQTFVDNVGTYTDASGNSRATSVTRTTYNLVPTVCGTSWSGGGTTAAPITRIDRPDGSYFAMTYEMNAQSQTTTRIKTLQIPTGATITYGYSGGTAGFDCAHAGIYFSPPTMTRNDGSGNWTYSVASVSSTQTTTTVTDPQGNKTVYTFKTKSGGTGAWFETQRLIYSGASTLMKTVNIIYNGSATNPPDYPITQREVDTILPGVSASKVIETYDATYGVVTSVATYDFGASTPTNTTVIAYGSWNGASCDAIPNVHDHVCYKTTHAGGAGGTIIANHTNTYDLSAGNVGNLLTTRDWVAGSTWLQKSYTYDANGAVSTATDANGAVTDFTNGACNGFLPTTVTAFGLTTHATWDCNGGVQTSATNANGDVTTYNFIANGADPFWRVKSISVPSGDVTSFSYTPTSTTGVLNFGSSTLTSVQTLDSLGRLHVSQRRQSPTSSNYDTTVMNYDYRGRVSQVLRPCSTTLGASNCSTAGANIYTYDVLNRVATVTDGGNGVVTNVYSGKDVTTTLTPAPTGENAKSKNFEYDAFGNLKSVCEVTSMSGSGACGQAVAKTGFLTSYGYDALNRLISVTQGGQTRTYSYDGLGRATLVFNPEVGTTQYVYDSNPDNYNVDSPGDLVQVISNAGVKTNFVYDDLHRLTDAGLQPWGFYSGTANPVCRRFRYDTQSAPDPGVTVANTLGRMELGQTDDCGKAGNGQWNMITREWFSYDNNGRMTDVYESTPHSGGFYHSSVVYAPNGAVTSLSPGIGGGQVTLPWQYGLDGEGRPYSVGNPVGGIASLVASTTYNVDGTVATVTMANGDTDAYLYDGLGRTTQFKFTVGSTPKTLTGTLTRSANGTLDQLAITDQFNAANSQTCTYGYDDLARLSNVNCGTPWSQTFTYDRFGNVFKSGNGSFQPTYSATTNRMTAIVGESAPSYDANGNLLNTEGHTYAWDANWSVPSSVDGKTLIYDAFSRMVEVQNGATNTEFMYGPTGKLAKMNGATEIQSYEPIPSGVVVHTTGTNFIRHNDWLGTSRFASTYPGRTMYFDAGYGPFGEQYASSGTTDLSFTGQTQDVTSLNGGLYDFPARKYSPVQGRFVSPDLGGSPNVVNPQSWNMYAYVGNNPMSVIDPTGNDDCTEGYCDVTLIFSALSPNDMTTYRQLLSDMANEAAADMPTLSNPFDALTPTGELAEAPGNRWQSLSFDLMKLAMGISPNTKSSFSSERERALTVVSVLMGTTIAAGFAMAEEPEIPEFGWAPDELWGATSRELPAVHISDGNIRFYKGLQHGVTELNPAGATVSTSFRIAEQYAVRSGEVKVWDIPAKEIAPLGLERGYTNLNGVIGDEIKLSPSAVEVFNRYKATTIRTR